MIDWTKPVQTRDGRDVVIYCTDAPGDYPVHGRVEGDAPGDNEPQSWTLEGAYCTRPNFSGDLVNVPPPKQSREVWVNVYPAVAASQVCRRFDNIARAAHIGGHGEFYVYQTKKDADRGGGDVRIACVPVTIEFYEGQGLEEQLEQPAETD